MSPIIKSVICGLISFVATLIFWCVAMAIDKHKKRRKEPMCDSCKILSVKRSKWEKAYRYSCECRGSFDIPLEYCKYYKPKETEGRE